MHKNFSELINLFSGLKDEFKHLGINTDDTKKLLNKFKVNGNAHAHNIAVKVKKEEIDKDKGELIHLIKILTERIYIKLNQ